MGLDSIADRAAALVPLDPVIRVNDNPHVPGRRGDGAMQAEIEQLVSRRS